MVAFTLFCVGVVDVCRCELAEVGFSVMLHSS